MKVKLNIMERVLVKISCLCRDLSYLLMNYIHRKHDPEDIYHSWSYSAEGAKEIIYTNDDEES